MKLFDQIEGWLRVRKWRNWVRFGLCTVIGLIMWKMPTKGVQDGLVWLAFLWAVSARREGWRHWRTGIGVACGALIVYSVAILPMSDMREMSLRDAVKGIDVFVAALIIPVVFSTRRRMERGLLYTAVAFVLLLAYHLVQMGIVLKGELFVRAHGFEPFILHHSNVASMAAGVAFFILVYFAWKWRAEKAKLAVCVAGLLVTLLYKVVVASRGPQIAFAGTIAVSGVLLMPKWRGKLIWLLLMVAAVVTIATVGVEKINSRLNDESMGNFTGRTVVWRHTWELAKERPVIGYGYGKRTFMGVYHGSGPPPSPFEFIHPHQYWLYVLFCQGWIGVALHGAIWLLVVVRLVVHMFGSTRTFSERLLPGTVLLMIVFMHIYSLADWPSAILNILMVWLVPTALVVTSRQRDGNGDCAVCSG